MGYFSNQSSSCGSSFAFLLFKWEFYASALRERLTVFLLTLFSKQMNPYIEDILNRIQDLLALSPPVSISPGITETVSASSVSHSGRGGWCVQSLLGSVSQPRLDKKHSSNGRKLAVWGVF